MKVRRPKNEMISWNLVTDSEEVFVTISPADTFGSLPLEYLKRLIRKNSKNFQRGVETSYLHAFYAVNYNGAKY